MDFDLLNKALKAFNKDKKFAFATIVEATLKGTPQKAGAKMLILEDGTLYGTIGGGRNEKAAQKECLKAIKSGQSKFVTYSYFGQKGQSVCGGQIKVYIEPQVPKEKLIICGAGHIALPLSIIAKMLNFHVTVIDNRKAFLSKERFGHADKIILGTHAKKLKSQKIDKHTHIMIVTQGNEFDYECLKEVIKTENAYLGVISSKAKKIKFFKRLKNELKVAPKFLNRIKIPAGLDIGSQTPAEIAVSIMAEIISSKNQKNIKTAKFEEKAKI